MITIENYINGELVAPVEGKYLDNYNPSKGEVYSQIPNSQANDVEKAVKAASEAFPEWSKTPKNERSKILVRLANLIDENLEELAKAEAMDNGKPYSLATRVDIPRASANIRFFATAILHNASESHHMEEGFTNFTLNHPLGVVGCIFAMEFAFVFIHLENCSSNCFGLYRSCKPVRSYSNDCLFVF